MRIVAGPRRSSLAASVAFAGALVALLAGFPLLLSALAGWPLPHAVPTWGEVATGLADGFFPDRLWIGLVALAGWVAWAQLVMAVVVEAPATAAADRADRRCSWPHRPGAWRNAWWVRRRWPPSFCRPAPPWLMSCPTNRRPLRRRRSPRRRAGSHRRDGAALVRGRALGRVARLPVEHCGAPPGRRHAVAGDMGAQPGAAPA